MKTPSFATAASRWTHRDIREFVRLFREEMARAERAERKQTEAQQIEWLLEHWRRARKFDHLYAKAKRIEAARASRRSSSRKPPSSKRGVRS